MFFMAFLLHTLVMLFSPPKDVNWNCKLFIASKGVSMYPEKHNKKSKIKTVIINTKNNNWLMDWKGKNLNENSISSVELQREF